MLLWISPWDRTEDATFLIVNNLANMFVIIIGGFLASICSATVSIASVPLITQRLEATADAVSAEGLAAQIAVTMFLIMLIFMAGSYWVMYKVIFKLIELNSRKKGDSRD